MKIDPKNLSRGKRYHLLTSCLIPRPIAWIGTQNHDGSHNLAPFSYFNAFSTTPPIIGVGFGPHLEKKEKDTLTNIRRTGELTVNMASFDQADLVLKTSENLPYGEDEFLTAGLTPVQGDHVVAPRVKESKINYECITYQLLPLGDQGSTLLLAEIKAIHIADHLLNDRGIVDPEKLNV